MAPIVWWQDGTLCKTAIAQTANTKEHQLNCWSARTEIEQDSYRNRLRNFRLGCDHLVDMRILSIGYPSSFFCATPDDSLLSPHSHHIFRTHIDIDAIGCRNFMEGKVPASLFRLQYMYAPGGPRDPSPIKWAKDFVSNLLHISHSQWIYRNMSLHDHSS